MKNRYKGTCGTCGVDVPPGAGHLRSWEVRCARCEAETVEIRRLWQARKENDKLAAEGFSVVTKD